ncbi:MAG: thiamine-binding protein [Candidatus Hydrothermarchaeota archaeon]|nr:MAG: thiamine-binding protein [Candidatus Hydrothermarchaeota archaeon]RLG59042.1 MAG: thiamine-binding protein [Candidatus Hydrothermarchaeota archaeon]
MIIAEFSVVPIGTKTPSVSKYVRKAIEALEKAGVGYKVGAMSTTIEAKDLDTLFKALKLAHNAVFEEGVERVVTTIKIDDRRDKNISIESKIEATVKY